MTADLAAFYNKKYTVEFDQYERSNLLWLFELMGYGKGNPGVFPFTLAHNGDWVGQLYYKLKGDTEDRQTANGDGLITEDYVVRQMKLKGIIW